MPIIHEEGGSRWQPPPEGLVPYWNDVPTIIDILEAKNAYCKACYTVSRDMTVLTSRNPGDTRLRVFAWEFLLSNLVDGAEAGCHFCGIFVERFFVNSGLIVAGRGWARSEVACCSLAPRQRELSSQFKESIAKLRKFSEQNSEAWFRFAVEPNYASASENSFGRVRFCLQRFRNMDSKAFQSMLTTMELELEFFAEKGSVAAKTIHRRPFNTEPGSEESVEQAQKWIDECLKEHEHCANFTETALPLRVVKILDEENLALFENEKGEKGSYTTLSYCWGGMQEFTLTANSRERMKSFKIADLPRTLRDATSLSRRLGIQYIWIDALCIFQDSLEDKARELPKMAQYYRNAHVTICASIASESNQGFLSNLHDCDGHPNSGLPFDLLRMPFISSNDEFGEMLFRQPFPYVLNDEPIEKRAWAFQERTLSSRVLSYGQWTIWQCCQHQRTHGGFHDFPADKRSFNFRNLKTEIEKLSKNAIEEESESNSVYSLWRKAVHAYSVRDMTIEADKLPAIAGLASVFADTTGDQYLAGLWRGQLLRDLLWSTRNSLHLLQPKQRRAPSWSWASVDNDVTYDHLPPTDAKPIARIINCTVTPTVPLDHFGHNEDGRLEIEGIVMELPSESVKKHLVNEYMMTNPFRSGWSENIMKFIVSNGKAPGGNEKWEPPTRCAYLPLFVVHTPGKDENIACGLVLAENEDGTFRRIADLSRVIFENLDREMETKTSKVLIV